jgi:hypothetical protein
MESLIRSFRKPPAGTGLEIIHVLKLSAVEKIAFNVLKWFLNFAFSLGSPWSTRYRFAPIMGNELDKGWIVNGTACFPTQDHSLFSIVEALPWYSTIVFKGIPVSPDDRVEITMEGEVNVLPPGEPQNVRETENLRFTGTRKGYGVRTPVHLSLNPRRGLEPDHRFALGELAHSFKSISQDSDPTRVSRFPQFFEQAYPGQLGKFFQQILYKWQIRIELTLAGNTFPQRFVPFLSLPIMAAQNAPDGISTDFKPLGQRPDGEAIPMHGDYQMFHFLTS